MANQGVDLTMPNSPSVVVPSSDNLACAMRLWIGDKTTGPTFIEPVEDPRMAMLLSAVRNSLPVPRALAFRRG